MTLRVAMYDAQGVELSPPTETSYLHGGYGGLLEGLERAVEGKAPGESVRVQLEPEDAFGDYDAGLIRLEPVERYGSVDAGFRDPAGNGWKLIQSRG